MGKLDGSAGRQWHRASSRCESVAVAKSAYPEDMSDRGYGARKPHQVSRSGSKSTEWVLSYAGETCSSRTESSTIIKADLRERMLPHGKENFEKK